MKKNKKTNNKGFTLIELLLYISILSLLLFVIGASSQAFLESRIKNQVISNVNHQGSVAMNFILQSIRSADSVTSPTAGNTANQIELAMSSNTPTCFRLSSNKIQISEGGGSCGSWVDITDSDKVLISEQTGDTGIFSNLSRSGTPGIIRARFNVEHKQPAGVDRYFQDFDTNFQGAAALR